MSKNEKLAITTLLTCLVLWILEPLHGISIALVAIAGGLFLFAAEILNRTDLRNGIPWE